MIVALLICAQAPVEAVRVEALAVDEAQRIAGVCCGDLDGDGDADVVLAIAGEPSARSRDPISLRGRLRGADGRLAADAAWEQAISSDVTCFAVGDLTADPGNEVLLLGGTGAFSLAPSAPDSERFTRIAVAEVLWQVRAPKTLRAWPDAFVDLDGDGRRELLLPEADAYAVAQGDWSDGGPRWERSGSFDLSSTARAIERERLAIRLDIDIAPQVATGGVETAAEVVERVPANWIGDWDGDGRRDLAGLAGSELRVWLGADPSAEPKTLRLPLEVDEQRRSDLSWAVHLGDVEGDGDADAVLVARELPATRDRTQVLVYSDLAAGFERPNQAILIDGLVTRTELLDVNGDGPLDLVVTAIRQDFLATIAAGGVERVKLDLYVYPGGPSGLAKKPSLRHVLDFPAEVQPFYLFCGDATGDGSRELLVRTGEDRLELFYVRARGDRWSVPDRSLWSRSIGPDVRLGRTPGGDPRTSVLVLDERDAVLLEVGR